jgi:hypothetical protein
MKKALLFTAYNRVAYLQQSLSTWFGVRGLDDWHILALIEPSPVQNAIKEEFEMFRDIRGLTDMEIVINPERYGVLHNPWVGFQKLLVNDGFDFVVRTEDDLVVSEDILEFFEWVALNYRGDDQVATAHAFAQTDGTPGAVSIESSFSPLVWGTWANRWKALLGPTWDHDYSTFNKEPGNQAGWDWNLNTRLFPSLGLHSVRPHISRVNNIGVHGTHSTLENFIEATNYQQYREPVKYYSTTR